MTVELHERVAARIRDTEGRYTSSRRRLVEALGTAGKPLTAEEIARLADGLALSSVYRNLAALESAGLVHRLAGHGDHARFELAEELVGHHHHLACGRCGALTDMELPHELEAELERALVRAARRRGFEVASHRVDAVGRCAECARETAGSPGRRR
jgi:Fur family transcriptional regulator, ferric uptake regulator